MGYSGEVCLHVKSCSFKYGAVNSYQAGMAQHLSRDLPTACGIDDASFYFAVIKGYLNHTRHLSHNFCDTSVCICLFDCVYIYISYVFTVCQVSIPKIYTMKYIFVFTATFGCWKFNKPDILLQIFITFYFCKPHSLYICLEFQLEAVI